MVGQRLFLGNLHPDLLLSSLTQVLEFTYGRVCEISLSRHKRNKSQFAFVKFPKPATAARALIELPTGFPTPMIADGETLRVELARDPTVRQAVPVRPQPRPRPRRARSASPARHPPCRGRRARSPDHARAPAYRSPAQSPVRDGADPINTGMGALSLVE